jgi:3-hydroxyacyl-CoA dehydrogenase / enoyl-CoA hydratase / 3-hydroxybutyryl-CoA epimerase / enoyl-CoA isomerase
MSELYRGKALRADLGDDGIVTLCFDREGESVNKFDSLTVSELAAAAEQIRSSNAARGVLVTSGKPVFIVGADIFEFTATFSQPEEAIRAHVAQQNRAFTAVDDLPIPTVAVINGLALGVGFEMALACDARVMSNQTGVGLPEVTLGLFPGFGGTVRLSRLIGAAAAIEWITSGKQQDAARALASHAVDEIAPPENLLAGARARLEKLIDSGSWRESRRRRHGPVAPTDASPYGVARGASGKNAALQPAALAAVDLLERAANVDRDAALALETEAFAKIARTQAAASMIQLFINGQLVQKKARAQAKNAAQVRRAAVLGAGIMGGGIAFTSASRGIPVLMKDIVQDQLDAGMAEVDRLLARQVQSKRTTEEQSRAVRQSIQPTLNFDGFADVDVVVEAIVENLSVKKRVLADVQTRIGAQAVLASNTSSLSIGEMATALPDPGHFVGLHFFNPVPAMPLVEVIRGPLTDPKSLGTAVAYASALGKTPIVVRDCPGFLVNRILTPYMLGFLRAVADGADFEQVDRVMEAFGWPMGPAFLQDVIGMDTLEHVLDVISAGYPERMKVDFPNAVKMLVKQGRLGQKSGSGWYRYELDDQGKRRKVPDPGVRELLATQRSATLSDGVILDRILLPMVLEAALCVEEGVAETAAEIDLALVLGLGFPRHAGGPLKYADWLGADDVVRRCEKLADLGSMYQPCKLLRNLANTSGRFYP